MYRSLPSLQTLLVPAVFGLTLFMSAGLLFLVEPMIAKMILPLLGGTPAVWNTCMMFFQALLLAGYLYAHFVSIRIKTKHQVLLHGALLLLALCCALLVLRALPAKEEEGTAQDGTEFSDRGVSSPPVGQRIRWVTLSFVPSSLMLGVTTFLSTDIAAIPLFWVIPLALYLLSFIIVFSRVTYHVHRVMLHLFPAALVALLFINSPVTRPTTGVSFLCNLGTFFLAAMVCHGELARSRPPTRHLTGFYLWMALGGVLGGVFNAVAAPLVFTSIAEYPLVLVFSAFLLPRPGAGKQRMRSSNSLLEAVLDIGVPLLLGLLTFWLIIQWPLWRLDLSRVASLTGIDVSALKIVLTYSIPAFLCYALVFMKRPLRFGLAMGALALVVSLSGRWNVKILHLERSFFGVHKVYDTPDGKYRCMVHGTTQHGKQRLDPARSHEPLAYYHSEGPVGQLFREFSDANRKESVALIGLGTGTLASYGEPGQRFTFYEIDPAVKRIATDPRLFTYLQGCQARWEIVLGDARLRLEEAPDRAYGLMVIDAFSSDAIPVHLLTREAFRLYFAKLEKTGVAAVHISNKYLDLEPVLGRLARDAGLVSRVRDDTVNISEDKYRSHWVLLARREEHLGRLARDWRWGALRGAAEGPVWTDDFSNLLGAFTWK
ncbi:MAG: fused MFS/spermidine synthase [Alphaproteobacteria bacterium]|uniref:Fused MFS/spermidine synthase n=1 Tax=Candidatus Nitrobium versatile TaxID=2884831 RepID=A0A953M2B2_9BACT|nr:fused MFS/spermidine synthase [Candidatus Nitrobium versatile]